MNNTKLERPLKIYFKNFSLDPLIVSKILMDEEKYQNEIKTTHCLHSSKVCSKEMVSFIPHREKVLLTSKTDLKYYD